MISPFEKQLTIAITVYDRRDYLEQAIRSALSQTIPVKVIVVEDCGPDTGMKSFVEDKFDGQVEYHRNSRRRGLFDNWNACLELCATKYLSILHDDDFLDPEFVASMKELVNNAPERGLYFGETASVDEKGELLPFRSPAVGSPWRNVTLEDFTKAHMCFPGQMFPVQVARAVGGFRPSSLYCGDIEMWVNLTAAAGAAQIGRTVAFVRTHWGWDRGTSRAERSGRLHASLCVQQKRTLAKLRAQGTRTIFDRKHMLQYWPISIKSLVRTATYFSPRWLWYNHQLLIGTPPPNWRYAAVQRIARLCGPCCLKSVSSVFRAITAK